MTSGDKPNIPRVVPGTDMRSLPIGPMEGFLLTRIDGELPVDALAEMTGQSEDQVRGALRKLASLGAVEWEDEGAAAFGTADTEPPPAPDTAPATETGTAPKTGPAHVAEHPASGASPTSSVSEASRGSSGSPRWRGAGAGGSDLAGSRSEPSSSPPPSHPEATLLYDPALLDEEVELPRERRKRVLDTFFRLEELDYYALLGVARDADKQAIRKAYFALSKVFHPDTLYGRNLGSFKPKMEKVFHQITQAYETLGRKQKREAYDAYLGLIDTTRAAERRLVETNSEAEAIERGAHPTLGEGTAAPREQATASSTPSPGPRLPSSTVRRQLFARRLTAARQSGASMPPAGPSSIPPAIQPPTENRRAILRNLAQSLRAASEHTGTSVALDRTLAEARKAEEEGDLVESANALRLALAMAPHNEAVQAEYDRVHHRLAKGLAETYEKAAGYEEEQGKWAAAALSWSRVAEGRPNEATPHRQAALCLLKAEGDMRQARDFAQKAVDLEPDVVRNRVVLGQVYRAAGMKLNARRELEAAAKLDPDDEIVKNLLRELSA